MDILERLNRKFGTWYEGLFGATSDRELRPRDILRRILAAMEDNRREGLDGTVYVPNDYTLLIVPQNDDERDYLRAFLDADELAAAVRRAMEQHSYRTRGGLRFTIEETNANVTGEGRVAIRCRFDTALPDVTRTLQAGTPELPLVAQTPAPPAVQFADDDSEPGTVAAGFAGAVIATLLIRSSDGRSLEAFPLTGRGVQIGRSRQGGNDIILAGDALVSKKHARIYREAGQLFVMDYGSTNGTFVNTSPIDPEKPQQLAFGDEIRLGETTILLRPTAAEAVNHAPANPSPAMPRPSVGNGWRLVAGSGEIYALASDMTVGRALTCSIALIGNGVSAQHARLTIQNEQVSVEDLDTPSGTTVNGERIPARFPVVLYEGDVVAFGEASLRLERSGGR